MDARDDSQRTSIAEVLWCSDSDSGGCDGCTGETCGHPNMEVLMDEVDLAEDREDW